jgi:hypothetical protein
MLVFTIFNFPLLTMTLNRKLKKKKDNIVAIQRQTTVERMSFIIIFIIIFNYYNGTCFLLLEQELLHWIPQIM